MATYKPTQGFHLVARSWIGLMKIGLFKMGANLI